MTPQSKDYDLDDVAVIEEHLAASFESFLRTPDSQAQNTTGSSCKIAAHQFRLRFEQALTQRIDRLCNEADVKTLETVFALLNGDDNQVDVVKNYVWTKLQGYEARRKLAESELSNESK